MHLFYSHLRKCSGVKTNLYCSDLSASALALVLWSNTIHRKLRMKPSLTHLTSTDFLAYSIQQKWFRLSKKTKFVWETAARCALKSSNFYQLSWILYWQDSTATWERWQVGFSP